MTDSQLNISTKVSITLEESAFGCQKTVVANGTVKCRNCNGSGQIQEIEACPNCSENSVNYFNALFGGKKNLNCSYCGGKAIIEKTVPCGECNGAGVVQRRKNIQIKIPAGIDNGQVLSLQNEGNEDKNGTKGNFLIKVLIDKNSAFSREGYDLFYNYHANKQLLEFGGKITIPTLSGTVSINIPEKTKAGTVFRLRGKGIKHLKSDEIGDMYVTVAETVQPKSVEELFSRGYSALLKRDKETAYKYLKEAAEKGHGDAQGWLSYCYDMGWGTEKNKSETFRWASESYKKGSTVGKYMYGLCFAYGIGVERDYSEAVKQL